MLSAGHWQQLEALFHRASALPRERRAAFVAAEAGHDPHLRRELEAMLAVEAEATVRVRAPLRQAAADVARAPPPLLMPGTRCGPWALDGLLGSGGMGRVYLGHRADGAYRQQVAVKMIANPGLDARQRAFFEFECQMQAQMHHPAIAQIYDAGVHDSDRPYLVMEYIDGQALDRWCRAHRAPLSLRVQLLMQICQGVQHAHQKGVIHRDLKPSNVLVDDVDGRPQPKIIDFGIAVAGVVEPSESWSGGTPGYMSPEQGSVVADIDARSDVYSLGAMLYELLCGQRPSGHAGAPLSPARTLLGMSARERLATAVARGCSPRALRRALDDGLDAIVRKATAPQRALRYDAVSALLEDLDRWQRHVPPLASGQGRMLVARKFLRRHRLPVLAATLVVGCVLAALVASLSALSQARAQQAMARQRQVQLERMVAFQQDMLQSVDVDAMGQAMLAANAEAMTTALGQNGVVAPATLLPALRARVPASDIARDLLERYVVAHALQRLQRDFSDDPALSADLRQSLARALLAIGRYPAAIRELRSVLDAHRAQHGGGLRLVSVLADLAEALYRQGSFPEAAIVLDEALQLHGADTEPDDPLWLRVQGMRARVMAARGELVSALERQQALLRAWAPRLKPDASALLDVEFDMVTTLNALTRREAALAQLDQLLPRIRARYGDDAPRTLAAMLMLARLRNTFNEYERSLALATDVHARRTRSLGIDHPDTLLAAALQGANMVRLAREPKTQREAEDFMRALLERQVRVLGADHPETMRGRAELIRILAKQADPAKLDQAIAMQRGLLAQRTRVLGRLHPDTIFTLGGLSSMLARTTRYDEARDVGFAALEAFRQTMPEDSRLISATWDVIGQSEARAGRLAAARDAHANALRLRAGSRGVLDAHTTESAARLYAVLRRMQAHAAMDEIRTRYLDPVIARDPATLNASQRSVRDSAQQAIAGGDV